MKIKKILLPVDGSDGSLFALEAARDLAKKFSAEIILLNVVDIANRGSVHEFYAYDPVVEESLVKRGCRILDDTESKFKKSGEKAPIISDRKEIRKNEFLTGYEYQPKVNLDDGLLHHPAAAGEDPQFQGTEFEKEAKYEKHGRMNATQIKEGKLEHPAAAGEDPDFEGTEFQKKELFENRNKFNEVNENNNTLDKDDPMYMSRNDEMIDKDLPVDHPSNKDGSVYMSRNDEMIDKNLPVDHPSDKDGSVYMSRNDEMIDKDLPDAYDMDRNITDPDTLTDAGINSTQLNNPQGMGDQGYYNADLDPKLGSSGLKTPDYDAGVNSGLTNNPEGPGGEYDVRKPLSDHNSAVPERRGPVGVENSPRVNTNVSPELKGDIHPNQMNPHFVDNKSNENQMGIEKEYNKFADHEQDIVIKKVSLTGQAGDTIVTFSEDHNIDLIIMATRGSSAVKRFFLGSVTHYVMQHSSVPVLAIPVIEDKKQK